MGMNIQSLAPSIPPCVETAGPAPRRATRQVRIGGVTVGGQAPIVVQSMTNTDTADVAGTTRQIAELWRAGSEMVRVTVNTPEAAAGVPRITTRPPSSSAMAAAANPAPSPAVAMML